MEKEKIRTLRELEIGESVQVVAVGGEDQLRKHLLDMGLIPGTYVKLVKFAPLGDPHAAHRAWLRAHTATG